MIPPSFPFKHSNSQPCLRNRPSSHSPMSPPSPSIPHTPKPNPIKKQTPPTILLITLQSHPFSSPLNNPFNEDGSSVRSAMHLKETRFFRPVCPCSLSHIQMYYTLSMRSFSCCQHLLSSLPCVKDSECLVASVLRQGVQRQYRLFVVCQRVVLSPNRCRVYVGERL